MTADNTSLFTHAAEQEPTHRPLAERMRPQHLDDVVGHTSIIGPHSALRQQLKTAYLPSLILWGPPGVGKTTIARLLANEVGFRFQSISAVSAGVKDVKEIIEEARRQIEFYNKRSVLFIDEIHRFNKAQQDALLHAVENGTLVLIGATTENPSFEVIYPLLSRCQVLKLEPLGKEDLQTIIERAVKKDVLLSRYDLRIEAMDTLIYYGGGDARRSLNLLESAFYLADKTTQKIVIDANLLEKAAGQNMLYYDKKGEAHYDIISAFIKSVRGSDPDAAVYWLARMLKAGEDPLFIARRLIILASEDIGNAEPYALSLANAGFEAVHHIGMPEARIVLAQVTTYLASVPKSNAAYKAVNATEEEINKSGDLPVPLHLRNAPTKLMKDLKYGAGYKYPHDHKNHFVEQQYLPAKLKNTKFYKPTQQGREARLAEYLNKLAKGKKDNQK